MRSCSDRVSGCASSCVCFFFFFLEIAGSFVCLAVRVPSCLLPHLYSHRAGWGPNVPPVRFSWISACWHGKGECWFHAFANSVDHLAPHTHTVFTHIPSLRLFHLSDHSKCAASLLALHIFQPHGERDREFARETGSLAWAEQGPADDYKYAPDSLLSLAYWLSDTHGLLRSDHMHSDSPHLMGMCAWKYVSNSWFILSYIFSLPGWNTAVAFGLMPAAELCLSAHQPLLPQSLINLMNCPVNPTTTTPFPSLTPLLSSNIVPPHSQHREIGQRPKVAEKNLYFHDEKGSVQVWVFSGQCMLDGSLCNPLLSCRKFTFHLLFTDFTEEKSGVFIRVLNMFSPGCLH